MFYKSLDSILDGFHKTLAKLDAYVVKTDALIEHKIKLSDAHTKEADRLFGETEAHTRDIDKAQATRAKIADLIGA